MSVSLLRRFLSRYRIAYSTISVLFNTAKKIDTISQRYSNRRLIAAKCHGMETSEAITTTTDRRLEQAKTWLLSLDIDLQSALISVAGDASFRRYFRLEVGGESRILMDAPPPGENVRPFIDIARRLRSEELHAPEIFYADLENGYLLLEDLGDDLYRDVLDQAFVDTLPYGLFDVLKKMALNVNAEGLPEYTAVMLRTEINLFPDWYLGQHRNEMSRTSFDALWGDFCNIIIESALEQPACFVHHDFHSSNLLRTAGDDVAIIDFQDAVRGPVSYDLISLLWDRYISWPRQQIEDWMEATRQMLVPAIGRDIEPLEWRRYCDLMGLQRNLKIVGIFARLYYRDGKHGYIEMIPRFYDYVTDTLRRYPEFAGLLAILEQDSCVP
jgi:aminoglycoside/choline kinase family phosphotransferase